MRRTLAVGGAAGLALALLTACGGGGGTDPRAFHLPLQTARPDEKPLPYRPVRDGQITFAALGLATGIEDLVGSHADEPPRGQFIRIRVLCQNGYPNFHTIDLYRQTLVTTDGRTHQPDGDGMRVARQPATFDLGAGEILEFDLYYDIPKDERVASLRLFGAPSTELGVPLPGDPGATVPLR
jgi:hypothetical protein